MAERFNYGIPVSEKTRPSGSIGVPLFHNETPHHVRGDTTVENLVRVSLTQHGETPYAKDGSTIFMSDLKGGDIKQPEIETMAPVEDGNMEQALANLINGNATGFPHPGPSHTESPGRVLLSDIVTRQEAAANVSDPVLRTEVERFDKERQASPLSNEKAWPTEKLKNEYRKLYGITALNRFKARIGIGKVGLTEVERQSVAIQPFTRMILHELTQRGENVNSLFQEVAAEEQKYSKREQKEKESGENTKQSPLEQFKTIVREEGSATKPQKPERSEVIQNAKDTDEDRMDKAWKILSENGIDPSSLSEEKRNKLENAVLAAHEEGKGEQGLDGTPAKVFNFTPEQLRKKAKILEEAGITDPKVRRQLMEAGIVGTGDAGDPGDIFEPFINTGDSEGTDPRAEIPGRRRRMDSDWDDDSSLLINPVRTEGHDIITTPRPDPSFSAEVRRPELKAAWEAKLQYENRGGDLSEQQRNFINLMIQRDTWPQGYQPGEMPSQGVYLDDRHQAQQAARRQGGQEIPGIPSNLTFQELLQRGDPEQLQQLGRVLFEQGRRENPDSPLYQEAPQTTRTKKDKHRGNILNPREREYTYGDEKKITSAEALAEEIMRFDDAALWGKAGVEGLEEDGLYPLLEEYYENGKVKKVMARQRDGKVKEMTVYKLNEENFLRWVRDKMMYWHDDSPDEVHDFGQKVALIRDFGQVNLASMVNNASRFFRSEATGEIMEGLVNEIKRESWLFGSSRSADIEYRQVMGSDEDLPKQIIKMFYGNTFTKTVWGGKSALYWIMNLPEKFRDTGKEIEGDSRVGRALNLSYHVYYNISDKDRLIELLGPDTGLLKPEVLEATLKKLAVKDGIDYDKEYYVDPKMIETMKKDDEGLMEFINIFNHNGKPTRIIRAVREIVQQEIAERFDLKVKNDKGEVVIDDTNTRYADTFALSMMRWTGGASRNDVNAQGYDAWTRVQVTDEYRKKQPVNSRGGAFGNPYNINFMKQVGADFLTGTQVQNMEKFDGTGKELVPKSTLQVMEEMQRISKNPEAYKDAASQLVFSENTMRGFALDHLGRAFSIFQQLQGAEEVKLDKFTHYDPIYGLTFERQAFEEALKEKFFKPMRYGYSTYGQINFGKMVRSAYNAPKRDEDGKIIYKKGKMETEVKYRDMRLAEAMFGREVIEGLGHDFFVHGKENIAMDAANWTDKIDWEKVNSRDGKVKIWRQVALARIAAELYAHRDYHSTDPKYSPWYYEEVIETLELLPNVIWGDETDMQGSKAMGSFFDHHDIEWLRKKAGIERWKIFRQMLINDIFKGSAQGLKKALQLYYKAIVY